MKSTLIKILNLFVFVALASCLPQEKTTQCGSGEAYNATQRKCVTTLSNSTDSISIASVNPTSSYAISTGDASRTHSVTVSDPFSLGYSIRWNVTNSVGSTTLVGTGLSYTFIHTTWGVGNYILEAQLLDSAGSKVLDTRSWSINVIGDTVPTISAITATPFTTTTTSPATTVQSTAANPDAISNVNYEWYVNGAAVAGSSGTFSATSQTLNFSFDPTSASTYYAGAGTYSLQLILSENGTGVQYDSYTWSISNNLPGFATVSLGTGVSGAATGNATPGTASIITALDETDVAAGGLKNDIDGDGTLDSIDLCVQADDVTGVDGNGVFVDFLMNGVAIPNATNIQLGAANTSYCLGDIVAAVPATYYLDIPVTISEESRTLTAVVYDGFSGASTQPTYNGGTQITSYTWTTRVRQLNTPPVISIDLVNTGSGGNIACTNTATTTMSGCTITQDTSFDLAITVTDDDYDPEDYAAEYTHFRVQFYVDGVLLDGTTPDVSTSDCYHTFAETANASRYICSLTINSWDSNGPVDPAAKTYTITAVVDDDQSPYVATGSDPSNTLTWTLDNVLEYDSNSDVADFSSTPAATDSFVSEQATPAVAIPVDADADAAILTPDVRESDIINFNIVVDDAERDSHYIRVFRCDDKTAACSSPVTIATSVVNSTDDTNPRTTVISHTIEEDAVIPSEALGDDEFDVVWYKVSIRDEDDNTIEEDSTYFRIAVENYNPDPAFNTANFSPALNTVGTPMIAYSGFPVTLDPGTITNDSLEDGDTTTYQWMISTDAGATYSAIDGATERVLVWTPGSEIDFATQTGTDTRIKLCLGDDGFDNALDEDKSAMNDGGTDCLNAGDATMESPDYFFTAFSNMQIGQLYGDNTAANVSDGPIAVWVDPSSKDPLIKYLAYVNVNKEIVVEKVVTNAATGVKQGSIEQTVEEISAISFIHSTDGGAAANDVTYLSMTGDATNGALYIAYMAPVSGVDITHVRRIDISGGKTGLTHDGKFGFDPGYDDLLDNFSPGAGLSEAINASGQLEVTVTLDAATQTTMAATMINIHGGSSTLTAGVDFCVPTTICTTTTITATEIASAINATTANEYQGFTASSAGSVVTLDGIFEDDWIEADIGASAHGDIMVNKTSGKWQLPVIDTDLSGGDKHKISIYQGDLGIRLADSNAAKTAILGTSQSQELANDILESDRDADGNADVDSDNDGTGEANDSIIIVTRVLGTGEIAFYELNSSLTIIDSTTDLFVDTDISDIDVTVSQNGDNPAAYVLGKNASNAFAYARVDHVLGNFDLSTATTVVDLDNDFDLIENGNVTYYDIAAGGEENQLLMTAVDSTNLKAYLLEISGSTPSIDCSYDSDQDLNKCMPLLKSASVADTAFDVPITMGDVLEDVTIGDAGDTTNENINDILLVGFHLDDGGGAAATDSLPVLGVLNVSGIEITADDTNPGESYNLPYVND